MTKAYLVGNAMFIEDYLTAQEYAKATSEGITELTLDYGVMISCTPLSYPSRRR